MHLSSLSTLTEDTSGLQIHLLGTFRIFVNSRCITDQDWRLQKARGLIQRLALAPRHQLPIDQITDELWPEINEREKALNNLHATLYEARRVLEPDLTDGKASSYLHWQNNQLLLRSPGPLWIDVDAFEAMCANARRSQDLNLFTSALALYTGNLLPMYGNESWEDWIEKRRLALSANYSNMLKMVAQIYRTRGEVALLIETLDKHVKHDFSQEDTQRELMLLYARSGQRYQAIRLYQRLQKEMKQKAKEAEELEEPEEPEEATTLLFQEIRAGNVPLDLHLVVHPEIVMQPPTPIITSDKRLTNLSTHTAPFIGRRQELEKVQDLLRTTRLLTLTGPGGCGKTRLAEQVAAATLERYPEDGVWLVKLAALVDPELVPQAVTTTLGLQEQAEKTQLETLISAIQSKQMLLILDNCEHLLSACADLATALLQACPHLSLLTTSRRPLHLPNECAWSIPPLSRPDPKRLPSFDELLTYDAIQFFLDRANTPNQIFPLTPLNALDVVHICHRLNGIPLAIELAAKRVHVASVAQIAARLDDCFAALATGKRGTLSPHQTLQAAIDWSYTLLTPNEQLLFQRLSVFAGSWMLEEAELVCSGGPIQQRDVLGLLEELVDHSLVVVETHQEQIRYNLLEVIRQYSAQKCQAAGEESLLGEIHARCYLQQAETAEQELTGPQQKTWLSRLEVEHENMRAALRWACRQGASIYGLRLVGALWRFWQLHGYLSEGLAHAQDVMKLERDSSPETQGALARALKGAGVLAYLLGYLHQCVEWYKTSLDIFRSIDDKQGLFGVLNNLGMVFQYQGKHEQALTLYEEAVSLSRDLSDGWRIATALNNLGTLLKDQGRYQEALPLIEESLALFRQVGDFYSAAGLANNLAVLLLAQGDFARATSLLEECLDQFRRQENELGSVEPLQNLALAAQRQGQYERARDFIREAMLLSRKIDDEWGQAIAWHVQGLCAYGEKAYQEAAKCYRESLQLQRKLEYMQGIAAVTMSLGKLHATQNRPQEARARFEEGLQLFQKVNDRAGLADAFEGLAGLRGTQQPQAALLFGTAAALRKETGVVVPPCDRSLYEQQLGLVRSTLGEETWKREWERGQSLPLDQVIAEALTNTSLLEAAAQPEPPLHEKQAKQPSSREIEIICLAAKGLTNREIASHLGISVRTVDTHMTKILAKLDLQSRAQLKAWAIAHGLI